MSKDTAKSGSDTERWHDFSATESGTHGQYGKYQFPEEIQCSDISVFNRLCDQSGTGSHVVGGSEKLCDHDNCNAGNNNADIDVFQIFRIKSGNPVQCHAEQNTESGTAKCHDTHFDSAFDRKCRNTRHMKGLRVDAHGCCKSRRDQRCNNTRNQCGIIHNTNTDYLHRKDGCCHRCSKQCCKSGTHTAHYHNVTVFFIQWQHTSKLISDTAAKLDHCTFSSG